MRTFFINFLTEMEKLGYSPIIVTGEGKVLWSFVDNDAPLYDKRFENWGVFNVVFRAADYAEYLVTVSNNSPYIVDWRKIKDGKDVVYIAIRSASR